MEYNSEIQNPILYKSSRYEANKKYYNSHKHKAHRLSLLFAVKTKGRIPSLATVEKYSLEIGEIVQKWREYKSTKSPGEIPPLKIMKFEVLLLNMV